MTDKYLTGLYSPLPRRKHVGFLRLYEIAGVQSAIDAAHVHAGCANAI